MAGILYWNGVSMINRADFENCIELIKKLLSGDTKSADVDLKRAKHTRIYSARINDADRLLFTTVNGKLLLLEVILNHDYQKSRFLKPGVAKAFIEKHKADIEKAIDVEEFLQEDMAELEVDKIASQDQALMLQSVSRYNEQFIQLREEQLQALDAPFPMLIIGPPGSGKSLLAVELLNQATRTNIGDIELPIVCICLSAGVRDHLMLQWQQGNLGVEILTPVIFLTYDELIQEMLRPPEAVEAAALSFVDKFHCYEFIRAHQAILAKLVKSKRFEVCEEFLSANCDLIYQEFYLISALTLNDYLNKGERETLFTAMGDRRAVYDTFIKYQQCLVDEGVVHAAFAKLPTKTIKFQKMIVDETQDFSLLQLQQLLNLTQRHQVACAMDPHQSLIVSHSLRSGLQQLMMRSGMPVSTYQLTTTHRCPTIIAKMANKVLALKNVLFDGVEDRRGLAQIDLSGNEKAGSVIWQDVEPNIDTFANEIDQVCQNLGLNKSQVALIVPDDKLAEFEVREDIDLVFSAASIKGLEYPCVLMLAPCRDLTSLHHYLPKDENDVLNIKKTRSKKGSPQKPMAQHLSKHFAVALNGVFVSLTRASQHLIVYQNNSNKQLSRLIHQLKSVIYQGEAQLRLETPAITPEIINTSLKQEASLEDWQKQCIDLYSVGNIKSAVKIYKNHLQKKIQLSFEDFIKHYYIKDSNQDTSKEALEKAKSSENTSKEKSEPTLASTSPSMVETKEADLEKSNIGKQIISDATHLPDILQPQSQWLPDVKKISKKVSALQNKNEMEKKIFINIFLTKGVSKSLFNRLYQSDVALNVLFYNQPNLYADCYSCLFYFILEEPQRTAEFYESLIQEENIEIKQDVISALVTFYNKVISNNKHDTRKLNFDLALKSIFLLDKLEAYVNHRIDDIFDSKLGFSGKDWADFLYEDNLLETFAKERPDLLADENFQSTLHETQFGGSIFYDLCCDLRDGTNVLTQYFELFIDHITAERLNAISPRTNNMTPLYQLFSSQLGLEFVIEYWHLFKNVVTRDGLNTKILGSDLFDNRTPLMQLIASNKGLEFIKKEWLVFKEIIGIEDLIIPRKVRVGSGASEQFFDAEIPLIHCFQSMSGIELVEMDMEFFIKPLTSSIFMHVEKQEGPTLLGSCFYALCITEYGRALMVNHWYPYFKKLVPVSAVKSSFAQSLFRDLWSLGYGVGVNHACEESFDTKYAYPNRMYLASYTNKDLFIKSWQEDDENAFIEQPMANGKSAFINLNELAHFNVETFKDNRVALACILNQKYEQAMLTKVSDITDEMIVLWYHLACCIDINAEKIGVECLSNLTWRLKVLSKNILEVVVKHVPSSALINQHLFRFVSALSVERNAALYQKMWPYYKSNLLSLNVEYHHEHFQRVLANENGACLLSQSYHEFRAMRSEPLYTFMSTPSGFETLCKFWPMILPHMTKKQLHEQHPFFENSAFDELCRTYIGYEFIVDHWDFFKDKLEECHLVDKFTHDASSGEVYIKNPIYISLKEMLDNHGLHLPSASVSPSKSAKKRQRKKAAKVEKARVSALGLFSGRAITSTSSQEQEVLNSSQEASLDSTTPEVSTLNG